MIGFNKQHPLYQEDLSYILSTPGIEVLRGKKILITGASGLIGLCLIDALMAYNRQGANITIYAIVRSIAKVADRFGDYLEDTLFHFIEQDVREPLPSSIKVDFIIPLASNTHPLAYSQYPIETIEVNIKGTEFALKKALECNATVLFPSSVEVYGNARGEDVFVEDYTGQLTLSNARSCYTESKRLCEAFCQSYISEKGIKAKIVRLSRVFGPTMLMSDSKASSQFIVKAVNHEDIVLKSKGNQFFSYTYVADVVSAMLYVLIWGDNGIVYNIANEKCNVHLKDFAIICSQIANSKVVMDIPDEDEKKGFSIATHAIMDSNRLNKLGFIPKYSFDDAVRRTVMIMRSL